MSPLRRAVLTALDEVPSGPVTGPDGTPDAVDRRAEVSARGGDPQAVPDLLRSFETEPDPTVREALRTQLGRHDQDEVAGAMAAALRSPDAAVRSAAVDVLVRTRSATARVLPGLVGDPDPDVRVLAVMVLAGMPGRRAEELLTLTVRTDPHPTVVSAAVSELVARLGARCADDVLAAAARFPDDPYVAFACRRVAAAGDGAVGEQG